MSSLFRRRRWIVNVLTQKAMGWGTLHLLSFLLFLHKRRRQACLIIVLYSYQDYAMHLARIA